MDRPQLLALIASARRATWEGKEQTNFRDLTVQAKQYNGRQLPAPLRAFVSAYQPTTAGAAAYVRMTGVHRTAAYRNSPAVRLHMEQPAQKVEREIAGIVQKIRKWKNREASPVIFFDGRILQVGQSDANMVLNDA